MCVTNQKNKSVVIVDVIIWDRYFVLMAAHKLAECIIEGASVLLWAFSLILSSISNKDVGESGVP